MGDPLTSLLHASHLLEPADLPSAVAAEARALGSEETVLYLADYEQVVLVPLPGADVPARREVPIEGTLAGLAFRRTEVESSTSGTDGHRLWVPLLDGVERLGVTELVLRSAPDAEQLSRVQAFLTLVAELLVARDAYSDVFARARRRRSLSLAAEMQWDLLPPLTFGSERVVISGGLEPAYDVGGDSFDYAVNGDVADLLVLDAVGHGLPAAVLASVAISAYRHARRQRLDLPDTAAAVDQAIAGQIGGSSFATAVLVQLELDTGRLRWINAGHPDPLILGGPALVRPPHCPPARPLGLQAGRPAVCDTRLEPAAALHRRDHRGPVPGRRVLRRAPPGRPGQRRRRGRRPHPGDRPAADAQPARPPGRPAAGRREHRRPRVADGRRPPGPAVGRVRPAWSRGRRGRASRRSGRRSSARTR